MSLFIYVHLSPLLPPPVISSSLSSWCGFCLLSGNQLISLPLICPLSQKQCKLLTSTVSFDNQLHWSAPSQRTTTRSPSTWLLSTSFDVPKFLCRKATNNPHPPYVPLDFTDLCHISFTYLPSWRVLVCLVLRHAEVIQHLRTTLWLFSEHSFSLLPLWRGEDESCTTRPWRR